MKKRILGYFFFLMGIVFFITSYTKQLTELAKLQNLLSYEETKEKIRALKLSLEMIEQWQQWDSKDWFDYMCTHLITGEEKKGALTKFTDVLMETNPEEYEELKGYLTAVWSDLQYFPVPHSPVREEPEVTFEDSWMYERTYGGKRGHEGTDLMGISNKRGIYPIVSISDGIVENIGWLPQGGYRIGIRSPHGAYFYYAHLYDYARKFEAGDPIKAGEFLGFMGDSGYSEIEGTVGKFDVHLHLGIYVNQPNGEEMSINPYWITKYLEQNKLNYNF